MAGGAREGPAPTKSARGGFLVQAGSHQFEVFFYPTGVRVFPRDKSGAMVDAAKLSGTATFYHPNSPSPWFSKPLKPTAAAADRPAESLDLSIGLTTAPVPGTKVAFEIADGSAARATFTLPLEFVGTAASTAAATAPTQATAPYRYGFGPRGFGYYPRVPAGEAAPAPARRADRVEPPYRDWSTGRDLPLAKPWMRPF
jgi:hypothetical protein